MRFQKLMCAAVAAAMTAAASIGTAALPSLAAGDETPLVFDIQCAGSNTIELTTEAVADGDTSLDISVFVPSNPGVNSIQLKFMVNDGQVDESGNFGNYGFYMTDAAYASPYCFDSANSGDASAAFVSLFTASRMNIIWTYAADPDKLADSSSEAGTTAWTSDVEWAYTDAFANFKIVVPQNTPAGEYKLDVCREKFLNTLASDTEKAEYGKSMALGSTDDEIAFTVTPLTITIAEPATESTTSSTESSETTTATESTASSTETTQTTETTKSTSETTQTTQTTKSTSETTQTTQTTKSTSETTQTTQTTKSTSETTQTTQTTKSTSETTQTTQTTKSTTETTQTTTSATASTDTTASSTESTETTTSTTASSDTTASSTESTETTTSTTASTDTTASSTESTETTTSTTETSDVQPDEKWKDDYAIADGGMYYIIGDVAGKPGEEVAVPVYVYGDTGSCAIRVYISYDERLQNIEATDAERGWAYTGGWTCGKIKSPLCMVTLPKAGYNAKAADGSIMFVIYCTIPEDAEAGTTYRFNFTSGIDESTGTVRPCETLESINDEENETAVLDVKKYGGSLTVLADDTTPALNYTSYSLTGAGQNLNLTLFNAYGNVTWTSSDENVATVDQNGFVTSTGLGNATITAANGGKDYTCDLHVGLFGDVNGNGKVEATDSMITLIAAGDIMAGMEDKVKLTESQLKIADVDGDGTVTQKDAQYILMYFGNTNSEIECTWRSMTNNPNAPDYSNLTGN